MKKKNFSDSETVSILQNQGVGGKTVESLCREYGIVSATFYNWKSKYGGHG